MGRWGYRLFEGDRDCDMLSEIEELAECSLGEQDPAKVKVTREKLNSGLADQLFTTWQKDGLSKAYIQPEGYDLCLLAAYMMHMGADINDKLRQYLNDKVPGLPGHIGFRSALGDEAFRAPGKVQFRAALANYTNGKPRDMFADSCFNCGLTEADREGIPLKKCSRCMENCAQSYYCDRECQARNWREHKVICKSGRRDNGYFSLLNV